MIRTSTGGPPPSVLGRVEISPAAAGGGRLDTQWLARRLFGQPVLAGLAGRLGKP